MSPTDNVTDGRITQHDNARVRFDFVFDLFFFFFCISVVDCATDLVTLITEPRLFYGPMLGTFATTRLPDGLPHTAAAS